MKPSIPPHPLLLWTAVLAACLFGSGQAPPAADRPAPVATVAGEPITAEAFSARYQAYLRKTAQQDSPRLRSAFLAYLVGVRLVVRAERDGGVEQDPAYRFARETTRRKLLLDAYAERLLLDDVAVTDEDLRAMFVRTNTRLRARHLYARTRTQADALYARLQRGEAFEALAREVFADSALAAAGGSVGLFGFDDMDPAFEEAAYRLQVGEVTGPVRTAFGYSIIQLEDRVTHPLLTEAEFARKKKQMRVYALRRKRTEAVFRHSQALAEAMDLRYDEATLARLMAQVEGTALLPAGEDGGAWLARPLVTFGPAGRRQTWTVAAFRERAQYTDEAQRARVTSLDHLRAFVAGLVAREAMLARAREAGLDAWPPYREALADAMEAWIYERAVARLEAETTVPEDSARAYFARHRAGLTVPERVRVAEILVETKAEADAVGARLADASFEEVRAEVERRLRPRYARERLQAHVGALRLRYPVTVHDDALARLPLMNRNGEHALPAAAFR